MIATAILDRLLHHAVTLNIRGNSYRLKEKLKAGLVRSFDDETQSQPTGWGNLIYHTGDNSVALDSFRSPRIGGGCRPLVAVVPRLLAL
jgi:hypothetical protein